MTNASRLERWLGREQVESLSRAMQSWYGPPVALSGVPGNVWACGGGEFRGIIRAGQFSSALDFSVERLKRAWKNASRRQLFTYHTGFSSLSDLIAEATAGKARDFAFQKVGTTGVVNVTNSLLQVGNRPPLAANAPAAPGGQAPDDSVTGFFFFTNPTGGDTQHFVSGFPLASVAGNTLLLYDCLFRVNKTMASTATEAVTGVPTRYQNTVAGSEDSAEGNFLFVQVGLTALPATAHNWTVCLYTDQSGTASTLPSLTGNASAIIHRLDHPVGQWFAPLESGDRGIRTLTQMQASASVATGVINFVVGHPIAWMPCPLANIMCVSDGINTAFNLVRIFDDAALAFLEVTKPATTATIYSGQFRTVAG